MSSVDQPAAHTGFLVTLLRAGAPVIAEVPGELPREVLDPGPRSAWRQIVLLAGGGGHVPDSLLMRACRYILLVPIAYRTVVIPVMLLSVLATNGGAGAGQGAVLAAIAVALNLLWVVGVLRVPGFRSPAARALLYADVAVALLLNLVASLVVPSPGYDEVGEMMWVYVVGSVALLTLARGVPAGAVLIVASIPFHVLLTTVGDHGSAPVASAVDDVVSLVPAMVTAMVLLILAGLGVRLVMGVGVLRGKVTEHARGQRAIHDTVLQTLEVIALTPPAPPADLSSAMAQLSEIRGIARAQAMELRRELSQPVEAGSSAGLAGELAELASEMAREGLRARLVFTDADEGALSDARRTAVRDAVREAMRNTIKHAGTSEVVLRVEQRDGGVAVIARDHGVGFSAEERPPGFGISNSINARLAEVGGRSTIESEPGRGTRVTLWVPL